MELELRLALPTHHIHSPTRGTLDLNINTTKETFHTITNKRSSEDAFGNIIRDEYLQKMPLLSWSGRQPNDEDDDFGHGQKKTDSSTINKEEDDQKSLVGWPPIQSWRKKLLNHHDHQVGRIDNNNHNRVMVHDHHDQKQNGGISDHGDNSSKYVKVKMEGVAITRKVNLRLYHSFHTLTTSLISMFSKLDDHQQKCEEPGVQYTLTYQDKNGDWFLARDVPWLTFIGSVHRLEILRNGG